MIFSMEGRKQHSLGYFSGPFVNVPPSLAILSKSWPLSQPGLRAQLHSEPRGGVSPQLSKQSPFAVTHINTGLRRGPLLGCERRQNPAEKRGQSGARRPQLWGRLLFPPPPRFFHLCPPLDQWCPCLCALPGSTRKIPFLGRCSSRGWWGEPCFPAAGP